MYSPAIDDEENIYVSTDEVFHCFYQNGTLKWENDNPVFHTLSPPTIGDDDSVYIQDRNSLFSIYKGNGTIKWRRHGGSMGNVMPTIGPDGTIYSGSHILHAFTPDGVKMWDWPGTGEWISSPTIGSEGTIYLSQLDHFYAIYPNGTTKWKTKLDLNIQQRSGIINAEGDICIFGINYYILGKKKPTPPSSIEFSSGDSFVNLSWSYPEDDGGVEVSEYRIYRGTTSVNKELIATLEPETFHYNDTSVVNGVLYYYSMTANNSEGESDLAPEITARPLAVPSSPRNFTAEVTPHFILLTWAPPIDDGGTSLIGYDLFKGTDINEMEHLTRVDVIENSYQDKTITIGETYHYYLTAVNIVGQSLPTEIVSATYRTDPAPPPNLTAASGNGFVHLSWLPSTMDGGSPIMGYNVHRCSSASVQDVVVAEPGPDVFEYNDTSVMNGVTYSYNVTTVTDFGISLPSNQVSATPMTFPDPPLNLTLEPGSGYINVTWDPPLDNGGSSIMIYRLYRTGGELDDAMFEISYSSGNRYQDMNLLNGSTYSYCISAVNSVGESARSEAVQDTPKGVPLPPEGVDVVYGAGFVHVSWESPLSDEGSPIIGYNVYRDSVHISDTDPNVLDFNDTDVENGMTYSYYITALNDIGESERSESVWGYPFELPVQTDPPTPPRNLTLEKGEDTITLSWDTPEDDGGMKITGYRICRGLKMDGQFEVVDTVSVDELSWTDDNIVFDREYFYYVTAFNDVHESGPSNKVSEKIESHVSDDDDDNGKEVNWLLIIIPAVLILLVLLVIGMFLIYRRGNRDDSEKDEFSQEVEYEPPAYDFDTIHQSTMDSRFDDDEMDWE